MLTFTCCDQDVHAECFLQATHANAFLLKRCFYCRARRTLATNVQGSILHAYKACQRARTPQPLAVIYSRGLNKRMEAAARARAVETADASASNSSTAAENAGVEDANDVHSRQASPSTHTTSESTDTTSTTNTPVCLPSRPSSPPPPYPGNVSSQRVFEAPMTLGNAGRIFTSHFRPRRRSHFRDVEYIDGIEVTQPSSDDTPFPGLAAAAALTTTPHGSLPLVPAPFVSTFKVRDHILVYYPCFCGADHPPHIGYLGAPPPPLYPEDDPAPPPRDGAPEEDDNFDAGSRFSVLHAVIMGIDYAASVRARVERRAAEAITAARAEMARRGWGHRGSFI